jgi:antitoxin component HigA of HigAB toxin-antitoxin module
MKRCTKTLNEMIGPIPDEIEKEVALSFEISDRIDELMRERGLTKKQLADALGRRPSEITKWLSGQHNFTISTLSMLASKGADIVITNQLTKI